MITHGKQGLLDIAARTCEDKSISEDEQEIALLAKNRDFARWLQKLGSG